MNMLTHKRTGLDTLDEANARMIREIKAKRRAPVDPEPKASKGDWVVLVGLCAGYIVLHYCGIL